MQTNLLSPKSPSSAPFRRRRDDPRRKPSRGMVFKTLAFLGGVLVLTIAIALPFGLIKAFQIKKLMGMKMEPPPTTVTSAKVEQADWQPALTAVGSIAPVQGATISAELPGTVSEVVFQSGTPVKQGDVLLKLDASAELAQLRSAQADAELAKADFDRARDLAARRVISQAELDAASSRFAQRQAAVDNMRSIIAKKEIRAPFAGIAGIREVNPGQLVQAGQRLVSLQALDQVYVDFSLPQHQLAEVAPGLQVKVTTDAIAGREFDGKVTAVNSAIDPATRMVSVQATLDNPDHALRAGMFARVKVLLPRANSTLSIPATAIAYAPYGNSVYVIEKKKDEKTQQESLVLRQQFIRTGETRGDFIAVTEGLKVGDEVVGTGVFKLRNGMAVNVDNKLAPKMELEPKPADT
ncbi:MAG TPA: efflux RND transporter periplasmic adaptor subunit [Chthoniobacterales bacterium]|nr:efflux RND transporter periplasmic adaptor subunit [Chthoniobacterales bacterium]